MSYKFTGSTKISEEYLLKKDLENIDFMPLVRVATPRAVESSVSREIEEYQIYKLQEYRRIHGDGEDNPEAEVVEIDSEDIEAIRNKVYNETMQYLNEKCVAYKPYSESVIIPQGQAFISKNLKPIRVNGKYSPTELVSSIRNLDSKAALTIAGLAALFSTPKRSGWVEKAGTGNPQYAANVPLFLAAYKKFDNINYEDWDWSDQNMIWFTGPELFQFAQFKDDKYLKELSKDSVSLAAILNDSINVGARRTRNSYKVMLKGKRWERFIKYPEFVKMAMVKCWIFQPHFHTEYSISSIFDLDAPPEELNLIKRVLRDTPSVDSCDLF